MDDDRGIWNETTAEEIDGLSQNGSISSPPDDELSRPFIGRWNGLVSQTNWEKGRIICQWREALQATDVAPGEYSDEAWSRRVGGVTGQHVGRLRRVYQRFGGTHGNYSGLFWSHFFAALEWDDAEMWLEGAVQNGWSVSQTRRQRWETLGEIAADKPLDEEEIHSELDEDFEPALRATPERTLEDGPEVDDETDEVVDFNDDVASDEGVEAADVSDDDDRPARVRPFADIPDLPDDLADAFDAFKLAILAHRSRGWPDVTVADVVTTLEALKTLALAPADD